MHKVPSAFKFVQASQSSPDETQLIKINYKKALDVAQPGNLAAGTPISTVESIHDSDHVPVDELISYDDVEITKVELSRYKADSLTEEELKDQEAKPMLCEEAPRSHNAWPKFTTATADMDSFDCTMSLNNSNYFEDEVYTQSKFKKQQVHPAKAYGIT